MGAEVWAVVVAVVAIVVSIGSAIYAARQSRHVESGGFKTAEDLKVDLVALLAALRSCIYKGIAAGQDGKPRDIGVELDRIREFQTSPSGYALAAFAAEQGSGSGPTAGRWRTLGLMFAELGGAVSSQQGDGSVGFWATEIETTLGALTSRDVDLMAQRVGDLPPMIASLVETRRKDMLLALSFEQADEQRAEHDPRRSLPALLDLRAAGVDDPNVNLWIGFLTDDTDLAAEAIAAGADRSLTVEQIVAQHKIKH